MNPCPCGEGGPPGWCQCSEASRATYGRRVSGPLLDRFDLRVTIPPPDVSDLLGGERGESTADVAERVERARLLAEQRGVSCNAELPSAALDEHAPLTPGATAVLEHALRCGSLSARGLQRIRRVART